MEGLSQEIKFVANLEEVYSKLRSLQNNIKDLSLKSLSNDSINKGLLDQEKLKRQSLMTTQLEAKIKDQSAINQIKNENTLYSLKLRSQALAKRLINSNTKDINSNFSSGSFREQISGLTPRSKLFDLNNQISAAMQGYKSLSLQAGGLTAEQQKNLNTLKLQKSILQEQVTLHGKTNSLQDAFLNKTKTLLSYLGNIAVGYLLVNTLKVRVQKEQSLARLQTTSPLYGIGDLRTSQGLAIAQKNSEKTYKDMAKFANTMGANFQQILNPYSKFMGSRLRGANFDQQQFVAKEFLRLSSAMQLSGTETESVFTAISQMANKGRVSMQELSLQLAEKIPGGMQLAADSMNMTREQLIKLVSTGELKGETLLINMAKQINAIYGGIKLPETLGKGLNRLSNAFREFQEALTSGVAGALLNSLVYGLTSLLKVLKFLAPAVILLGLAVGAKLITNIVLSIISLKSLTKQIIDLGLAAKSSTLAGGTGNIVRANLSTSSLNTFATVSKWASIISGIGLIASSIGDYIKEENEGKDTFASNSLRYGGSALTFGGIAAFIAGIVAKIGMIVAGAATAPVWLPVAIGGAAVAGAGYGVYNTYQSDKALQEQSSKNTNNKQEVNMTITTDKGSNVSFDKETINIGNTFINLKSMTGSQL